MNFFDKEEFYKDQKNNSENADNSENANDTEKANDTATDTADNTADELNAADAAAKTDKVETPDTSDTSDSADSEEMSGSVESREYKRKLFWGGFDSVTENNTLIKNTGIVIIVSLVTAALAVFFCINYFMNYFYGHGWLRSLLGLQSRSSYVMSIENRPQSENDYYYEDGRLTAAGIAKEVSASVVSITTFTDLTKEGFNSGGVGSGIILSEDGYIVTNYHVVDAAQEDRIIVTLVDGNAYHAELIGFDDITDIAVLKIEKDGLTPATFGDSSQALLGEEVFAIGNSAGLDGTISKGIISGLNRKVINLDCVRCIQIDAALNPGNSGGALVNSWGQVIGITSSKLSSQSYDGIGFAIEINDAKPVIDSLIKNGFVKRNVRIGIEYLPSASLTASGDFTVPTGLYVVTIDENCDISNTELRSGDFITEIDGQAVSSKADTTRVLANKSPGDKLTAKVYRMDGKIEFEITFALEESEQ